MLLSIELDGTSQLALAKDIQRDPIKPVIEHVDLVMVRRGEKVTVDVPVQTAGEASTETVVTLDSQTLQLLVEATRIPTSIVVDLNGVEAGTQILAADVDLPEGAELVTDPQTLVINVTAMISQEALDAELAEAEGEAAPAAAAPAPQEAPAAEPAPAATAAE